MVAKPEDYYEKEAFKRLKNFADAQQETPFLVVDSATFTRQLDGLIESFPYAKTYYAIKANPMPELLRILRNRGCNFDVASRYELDKVLARSEEHTSELQSRPHLVCRLLLEK